MFPDTLARPEFEKVMDIGREQCSSVAACSDDDLLHVFLMSRETDLGSYNGQLPDVLGRHMNRSFQNLVWKQLFLLNLCSDSAPILIGPISLLSGIMPFSNCSARPELYTFTLSVLQVSSSRYESSHSFQPVMNPLLVEKDQNVAVPITGGRTCLALWNVSL